MVLKNLKSICPNPRFTTTHHHQKERRFSLLMCFVMELLGHFGHIFLLLDAPNRMKTSWRVMTYDENSDQETEYKTRIYTVKESTTGTTPHFHPMLYFTAQEKNMGCLPKGSNVKGSHSSPWVSHKILKLHKIAQSCRQWCWGRMCHVCVDIDINIYNI